MKNILFLIAQLGNGGAERVSTELANEMHQRGHKVSIIVFDDSLAEYKVDEGIEVRFLKNPEGKTGFIKRIGLLRKEIDSISPDYIVELGFAGRYLYLGGISKKYKVITSCRNDPSLYCSDGLKNKLWRLLRDRYQKQSYKMVFQTEDAKNYFAESIQKKSKIIPNPIKENLPERHEGKRDNRIVAFSRLNKQKNLTMLLKGFAVFQEKHPDYTLEIYGRGEELDNLIQEAKNLGISESVYFCGFCSDIHKRILSARMFVSTSDYEGISNSMLEALGVGLPVICTDCPVGGARMAIESGVNGVLIPVRDQEALIAEMIRLAEDDVFVEKISTNAVAIRERLSIRTITDEWLSLMEDLGVSCCNMKIGIVTWYKAYNYGTVLQAYSLMMYLRTQGYECDIVDVSKLVETTSLVDLIWAARRIMYRILQKGKEQKEDIFCYTREAEQKFDEFFPQAYTGVKVCNNSNVAQIDKAFDCFITGSDQIWNPDAMKSGYLLKFASMDKRKVAYSSSFGVSELPKWMLGFYRKYLGRFDTLYLREKTGCDIVRNQLGLKIPCDNVLDPTLLPDATTWDRWLNAFAPASSENIEPYCVYYFVGRKETYKESIRRIARETGLKVIALPFYPYECDAGEEKKIAGPVEFITTIRNASLVCTDSFHATCFTLLYERPLYVLKRFSDNSSKSQNSRLADLLGLVGLKHRIIEESADAMSMTNYEYNESELQGIREGLACMRKKSHKLLIEALR